MTDMFHAKYKVKQLIVKMCMGLFNLFSHEPRQIYKKEIVAPGLPENDTATLKLSA